MSPKSPDAYDAIVGHNIRITRQAKGMSQTELGQELGVSFQQVQKYETGTNRVGVGRLIRIAEALDVPVTALLAGVPGVPSSDGATVPHDAPAALALIADREPFRLVQSFSGIPDRGLRRAVVRLVQEIAQINGVDQGEVP
jgi:transcriptional regulator with XRE-family HTH domain